MAKYEDYVVVGEDGIAQEIDAAAQAQQARERDPVSGQFVAAQPHPDATPNVDWQKRYQELEKLNSRQAQTLGEYRHTIDEFIASPTPSEPADQSIAHQPITVDALYEDPDAAINSAVENHPAIREARALQQQMLEQKKLASQEALRQKHPDIADIAKSPEFQNWVVEDATRLDLYQRGDAYDFGAADALFSLYKAESGIAQVNSQHAIQQAELVSSSGEMVQEPARYSRSEYINKLKRSKQGDLEAKDWVSAHVANYRLALQSGNVRD
jgi:hypothetical protein